MTFAGISSASVANVYLAQSVAGTGDGSSCSNAKAVSFFNSSSNWGSGSSQIGPGTTVHLCGTFTGGAGSTMLTAQGSGSSGSPVTIQFESGARLSAPYWGGNGAISIAGLSWIVVDGNSKSGIIENTANGTGKSFQQDSVGIQMNGCTNCEVRGLTIQNLYTHTSNTDTASDATQINCIQFQGSNIQIHDNLMHDVGWCLYQNYTNDNNVKIYNNEIYNMAHGIVIAGANFVQQNIYIYNNHLHDMANWNTTSNEYHLTGIHAYNGSGGKTQNAYIYNNLFDGSLGTCCITGWIFMEGRGSGTPWTDSTGTASMWNNVFISNLDVPNGLINVQFGSNHTFLNNTVIGPNGGNNGICLEFADAASNVSIENNVMEGCTQLIGSPSASTFAAIDYNSYGKSSGGNPNWQYGGMQSTSLSGWRSACSCDSHSVATSPLTIAIGNISLSTGMPSSSTGGGLNLTSIATGNMASLQQDTSNGDTRTPVTRPSSGSWDIGAFQFQAAQAATPTFSPVAGTYSSTQSVSISTTSAGAVICYNTTGSPATNGTTGCSAGTLYSGPVSVASNETLFAVAGGTGFSDSSVGSAAYVIAPVVATPTFSPVAGTYSSAQSITITSSTTGATICYTTDGTTPTANGAGTCTHGTTYTTPVSISSSLTLKAIGSKSGDTDSSIGSSAYIITTSPPPAKGVFAII